MWGLLRATTTSQFQDVSPIDLATVPEGEHITVQHDNKPVFIRHLTPAQYDQAASVAITSIHFRPAMNRNLPPDAPATAQNRVLRMGQKFAVVTGICPNRGCVPMAETGNYGGWVCPCGGAHFDVFGRLHKGPTRYHLTVPRYKIVGENQLVLLADSAPPSTAMLERLIYGEPQQP